MIRHNLKTALRNLWKYKLQTLISIVSLAVGLVAVAAVHTITRNFTPPPICQEPYYERCYQVFPEHRGENESQSIKASTFRQALTDNGGLRNAEDVFFPELRIFVSFSIFHKHDSTERNLCTTTQFVDAGYFHYRGIRSAITGEKIPVLKKGEVIISQECANQVFGNENPIGLSFDMDVQYKNLMIRDVIASSYMNRMQMNLYANADGMDYNNSFSIHLNEQEEICEIILREGSTREQLEKELNERLKPLNITVKVKLLKKSIDDERLHGILKMRVILYLIAGMLLLAAVIGFLRMQVQLYWMRRRELLLRMTNGATWAQLYGMLLTETGLVVGCSFLLAVWLYGWLSTFLVSHPLILMLITDYRSSQFITSLYDIPCISLLLFILCAAVTGIVLLRICRNKQSFSAGMQQSHSHVFRNVMIGIQLTICMLFVCGTLELSQIGKVICQNAGFPKNEDIYKKCLMVSNQLLKIKGSEEIKTELNKNPNVEQIIPYGYTQMPIAELDKWAKSLPEGDPRANSYVSTHRLNDTVFLDFCQMPVHWLHGDADRSHCVLLSDSLMKELEKIGICQDGTLRVENWQNDEQKGMQYVETMYPIAGTVSQIPYRSLRRESKFMILIDKNAVTKDNIIVVPHKGKYGKLEREIKELVQTLHPEYVTTSVHNLRNFWAKGIDSFETIETGVHILCIVCLIICGMSIYSSISLDTRTRRKEMAIRKVNGAQRGDIALLFGRLYIVLLAVATIVAIPVAILFNKLLAESWVDDIHVDTPVLPILCGCLLTYLLVLCIVGWHILHIARVNPVEYIAKE